VKIHLARQALADINFLPQIELKEAQTRAIFCISIGGQPRLAGRTESLLLLKRPKWCNVDAGVRNILADNNDLFIFWNWHTSMKLHVGWHLRLLLIWVFKVFGCLSRWLSHSLCADSKWRYYEKMGDVRKFCLAFQGVFCSLRNYVARQSQVNVKKCATSRLIIIIN